jgi:hypothetical protein
MPDSHFQFLPGTIFQLQHKFHPQQTKIIFSFHVSSLAGSLQLQTSVALHQFCVGVSYPAIALFIDYKLVVYSMIMLFNTFHHLRLLQNGFSIPSSFLRQARNPKAHRYSGGTGRHQDH